jgi:cysteine desulfurase
MPMQPPIYLDYAAATPIDPRVAEVIYKVMTSKSLFGNSASKQHSFGRLTLKEIENARAHVANLIKAEIEEVIWTSGATEANNLALKGTALSCKHIGSHLITMSTEHNSVIDTCNYLRQNGFEITLLDPEPNGLLNIEKLKKAITNKTTLISIMHVNSETGVIQDIKQIGDLARNKGIIFHVDAAQSVGKIPINVKEANIDLMSLSAHKIYGPKGIGTLYINSDSDLEIAPLLHGGGQERGLRAGTLPTHQIIGMGEALCIAKLEMEHDHKKYTSLKKTFLEALARYAIPNCPQDICVPNILNLQFPTINKELFLSKLQTIAFSSGSACSSLKRNSSSHVLKAMGLNEQEIQSSFRFSLGRFSTIDEVMKTTEIILEAVKS